MVRLPSRAVFRSARGKQIGLIVNMKQILLWDVGGSLREVNTMWVPGKVFNGFSYRLLGVELHPVDESHFFVFFQASFGNDPIFCAK
jgi:hypothetical protein